MLKHFDKLHSPIHAVQKYPLLNQQVSRFTNAGWSQVEIARNLWDLWSDDGFTSPTLRRGLDTIEPFEYVALPTTGRMTLTFNQRMGGIRPFCRSLLSSGGFNVKQGSFTRRGSCRAKC
jgi:hypothetical protein